MPRRLSSAEQSEVTSAELARRAAEKVWQYRTMAMAWIGKHWHEACPVCGVLWCEHKTKEDALTCYQSMKGDGGHRTERA